MSGRVSVLFLLTFAIYVGAARDADTDYQSVQFASTDGAKTAIRGLVFRPDGAGPLAAVVGVHGCNGLFEGAPQPVEHYVFWARQLRDAGYLVLLIDSLGSRGIPTLCALPLPVLHEPIVRWSATCGKQKGSRIRSIIEAQVDHLLARISHQGFKTDAGEHQRAVN